MMVNGSKEGTRAQDRAMRLESLTPCYDEGQHGTYLRCLEEAVKDPRNLNIALTGRYGAGKSSVLDKFQENHRKTTQRLAIATLAPGDEGESRTNRIQKEIVKQLLYGASEKVGKNSRFNKIAVLGKRRAFLQSAGPVACVGGLLYLLGWLPAIKWTGAGPATWVRATAWAGAAVLVTLIVSMVRLLTSGRFNVSNVSAGGAALTLTEKPQSFFDMYLDEIVHYFGRESKDIVIFEDLDRFEDPHIFEALRELNILLNETPERRANRESDRPWRVLRWLPVRWVARIRGVGMPLRFIYAVRDSVFDKIDATVTADTASDRQPDAAVAETLHANRTKFFDIIIPLVPFISHRNARDLLSKLMEERGITGIQPRLVNTVARHCTDMRLMRNMCNEYLVFADRLLEPVPPKCMPPGMDESRLFALVAYKNFHLTDFENITRRDSDLDRLYELHQSMVRENITANDKRKRQLLAESDRVRTRGALAKELGKRIEAFGSTLISNASAAPQRWSDCHFTVDTSPFNRGDVTSCTFWEAVATTPSVGIVLTGSLTNCPDSVAATLDEATLTMLVPEGLDADRWADYDKVAVENELIGIETNIDRLRRADFTDLVTMAQFTLPLESAVPCPWTSPPPTFAAIVSATLNSQLACDLVKHGYIGRNFSLYAAQFYGRFIGLDVANFMVQHVQTNTMAVDYDLSRAGAVANLLAEAGDAGEEIEHTAAAFNIDIVNHLLAVGDPRSGDIADNVIARWPDKESRTFIAAYLTSDSAQRTAFAATLAKRLWPEVFTYLVADDDVPTDVRLDLVSAAMCGFDRDSTYDLGHPVREFITTNYHAMPAFTEQNPTEVSPQDPELPSVPVSERVVALLERAGVFIPRLDEVLSSKLRQLIVRGCRYELTADNLRSALGISGSVALDEIRNDLVVYEYCLSRLKLYLTVVGQDGKTAHAVSTWEALVTVLTDIVRLWDDGQVADPDSGDVAELLRRTAPDARLGVLRVVPESTWGALAAADLFRASLANLEDYRDHVGSIDTHLARLLDRAGTVHISDPDDVKPPDGEEYDRQAAAVAILNTTGLTPAVRVDLAASLKAPTPLPLDGIEPDSDAIFELLLGRGMVTAERSSFMHFYEGGADSIWPALKLVHDRKIPIASGFFSEIVADMLVDFSGDTKFSNGHGREILDKFDSYVPDDDWKALKAAAGFAKAHHIPLAAATVVRIARVAREQSNVETDTLLHLLWAASPPATVDDVIEVFTQIGEPYSGILRSGATFNVPSDDMHDQLLRLLKDANRITRGTRPDEFSVTVL